jgi:hypothetical protein
MYSPEHGVVVALRKGRQKRMIHPCLALALSKMQCNEAGYATPKIRDRCWFQEKAVCRRAQDPASMCHKNTISQRRLSFISHPRSSTNITQ